MKYELATLAGGCFWCTEALFKRLKGVEEVISGYSGGKRENPSYENVSTGATGHAEAIQIRFHPDIITYETLLEVFFKTHDPTTKNQQGADIGTQYRSVIFYHNEEQQRLAQSVLAQLEKERYYPSPIITEIIPFQAFYKAEEYHQNYYDSNRSYPYCSVVIDPKVRKLLELFSQDVKDEYKEE